MSQNLINLIQNLFETSTDVLAQIINRDGAIVYANKNFEERLKLNSTEDYSKNHLNDFSDFLNPIEIEKIKVVLQTQKAITFETVIKNQNYKFIVSPHLTSSKEIEFITIIGYVFHTVEDSDVELKSSINSINKQNSDLLELIEKLSLQNIELTKANNSLSEELINKDKFFSILSHDLRGQMGNMINSSDLIVESFDQLDIADVKNIIGILNKSIRKNYSLLDNLLIWASFERGKINMNLELIKINDVINNSLESLSDEISKKSITMVNNVTNDIFARCDLKYMELVFKNILSNAIKFSYSGGKVEISNNTKNDKLTEIIIIDSGTGMDEETCNNLFKIDKIHSNYGTEKETGSGMGLLVAKKIIDEIGGELKITTEHHLGTTVQIYCKKR